MLLLLLLIDPLLMLLLLLLMLLIQNYDDLMLWIDSTIKDSGSIDDIHQSGPEPLLFRCYCCRFALRLLLLLLIDPLLLLQLLLMQK